MHTLDSDSSLKLQHTLTQQPSEQRFKALYDKLDPPSSKRIVDSAMEKHAGCAWLKAIPTVPELSIPSDKTAVIVLRGYSCGNPLKKEVKECPTCNKRIDDFNVHMLLCSTKKALMQCHDAIKHCVKDLCVQQDCMWMLKPLLLGRESSDNKDQRQP